VNRHLSGLAGRPIYTKVVHPGECFESIPKSELQPGSTEAALPYGAACSTHGHHSAAQSYKRPRLAKAAAP